MWSVVDITQGFRYVTPTTHDNVGTWKSFPHYRAHLVRLLETYNHVWNYKYLVEKIAMITKDDNLNSVFPDSNVQICMGNDIVSWWRHQMEPFPVLLALCEDNPPVTDGFLTKSQWRRASMCSLICARTNSWAYNRVVGDLRRHRAHYGVTLLMNPQRNGIYNVIYWMEWCYHVFVNENELSQ